ncbi:MAG: outer membrane beta-barrel protein [Bacteroidota bacterium]|nr:outer membrane beta-barrel protein [Bacteroidota bacterium]
MKKWIICMAAVCSALSGFAQTDSSSSKQDTMMVGNFIIIKKNKKENEEVQVQDKKEGSTIIIEKTTRDKKKKSSNINTNWWIFDLGFANLNDNTNYTMAQAGSYLKVLRPADGPVDKNSMRLRGGKSSNVNIWIFMQKLNLSKHILNLKYGLGLEMYNFRYESDLSYRNSPAPFVFNDSINFSKNKLYAGYLTVPFMIHVNTAPNNKRGFSFSAGVSAGYLVGTHSKQISAERGKQKIRDSFDLQPWRVAAIGELGLGPVRLYGSYSLNALHKESTGLDQVPYAVGIRFSNW